MRMLSFRVNMFPDASKGFFLKLLLLLVRVCFDWKYPKCLTKFDLKMDIDNT